MKRILKLIFYTVALALWLGVWWLSLAASYTLGVKDASPPARPVPELIEGIADRVDL